MTLENEVITVRAGDSFSFPGRIVHQSRNMSDKPARLIWVNSPVIIPKYAVHKGSSNAPVKSRTAKTKRTGT